MTVAALPADAFCDFQQKGNTWRCARCGSEASHQVVRVCGAERHYCQHAKALDQTVSGTAAGCGCSSTVAQVYYCRHFNEPVLKHVAARCLDKIKAKVSGYTGRTCRECAVPRKQNQSQTTEPPQTIAVIVPCHNYGRYLRQCLDSVLAQTAKPETIILVDDASDDNTPQIGREYQSRGVQYLRGEWRDVAEARNAGAALCGLPAYYCFVDADDYLPANYLEELRAGMTHATIAATYPHMDRFAPDRELGLSSWIVPFSVARLRRANFATASSLIRRQAFEQVGGWRTYRWGLHDWDLFLRMVGAGWTLRLCDKVALRYRVHGNSMSDARHGHYECGAEVMSRSMLTSIVTLFSGRHWMLDRWFAQLAAIQWTHENLHLIAVDNSRNPEFSADLRARLATLEQHGIRSTYLRDDRFVVEETPACELADSAPQRMKHVYAMGVHLARLYAHATQYLPAATANVWSLEDDVGIQPDTLWTLATELFRLRGGAVCGCLRNRFHNRRLLSWSGPGQQVTEPPAQPLKVTGTGFFCLLAHRDAWDTIAWRAGATGTDRHPYYDWAACADIRANGQEIYLIGDVRCKHWQADGTALEA